MVQYKEYYIKPSTLHPKSYIVVTTGRGGKIPDVLSGMFTSIGYAKHVIDTYIEIKEYRDAKKINKSGV